jgi:hypothetical protein
MYISIFVSVFMILSKTEVSVLLLVCCVVQRLKILLLSHLLTSTLIHRFRNLFFDLNLCLTYFKLLVSIKPIS